MPISSTAGSASSSSSAASSVKWTPALDYLTIAITATTQDTAATLSVAVTSGQVVRYSYEYSGSVSGIVMPLYYSGATISAYIAQAVNTSGGTRTMTTYNRVTAPASGSQTNAVTGINLYTTLDFDVVASSAGTLALWVGYVNTGNTNSVYRRASIQIIA
jgi:hypothetical protein